MTDYLYRVVVTKMPEGSHWEEELEDGTLIGGPVDGWAPAGWKPEGNYVDIMGTTEFVWPVTNKLYKSRSTANKRAALLRRYGAQCGVERSSRITWPSDEPKSDFVFYAEPSVVAPGVHLGLGSVSDDSDRVFLSARDVELTPTNALEVAMAITGVAVAAVKS